MQKFVILIFGWYLILRIAQGGVEIGPYEYEITCLEVMDTFTARLKEAGIPLKVAKCVERKDT